MMKIFALANGRSGTKFLSGLFKHNVKNCKSEHEPAPGMFGKSIYWYQHGEIEKIRELFLIKKERINRYEADVYIETNHAFLKSFADVAMEFFPDMKLIHLIRNPLKVARSELNRENLVNCLPVNILFPDRYYRASDGKKYFRWALTGHEDIFKEVKLNPLTEYQRYVVQWIEIENRAISFLGKYKKKDDCFTLSVPKELNDPKVLKEMFNFFELKLKRDNIVVKGKKNKIRIIPTVVSDKDKEEFQQVVNALPDKYLKIFQEEPYTRFEWVDLLKKK